MKQRFCEQSRIKSSQTTIDPQWRRQHLLPSVKDKESTEFVVQIAFTNCIYKLFKNLFTNLGGRKKRNRIVVMRGVWKIFYHRLLQAGVDVARSLSRNVKNKLLVILFYLLIIN